MSGICVDSENNCPGADELFAAGADGVRMVARDSDSFFTVANDLAVSMRVVVVLARESFADDDWAGWCSFYSQRCTPWAWVIGNEQESWALSEESPSSWAMRPGPYAVFFKSCADAILTVQPDAKLVLGGFVAGQPDLLRVYLDEIRAIYAGPIYAADAHPYGKGVDEARDLLRAYAAILDDYGI